MRMENIGGFGPEDVGIGYTSSGGGGSGGVGWPSSSSYPKSNMQRVETGQGVREFGVPPPFLIKIYNMVNDPSTNSVISWSPSGTSFIVRDHLLFSAEHLPQYFKHSNFSSFIYQLNNYGFRKIGVEHQWEYENEYFQAGKEHLLTRIRRRSQKLETLDRQKCTRSKPCLALNKYELEFILGNLRNSINESKLEIQKLRKKQDDMETEIFNFKQHIEIAHNNTKKLLVLLAKPLDEIFVQSVSKKEDDHDNNETLTKKTRMAAAPENTEKDRPIAVSVSCVGESGSPVHDHKVDSTSEANIRECGEYKFWKELLDEDDDAGESEARLGMVNIRKQAKIAMELEKLIAKLPQHDTDEKAHRL